MQPLHPSSPLRSSRLENVRLEPGQATLDLDGKPVAIGAESAGPSLSALRSFCDAALADLRSRPGMAPRPGWLGRLRTWIGGLFGRGRPETDGARPPQPDRAVAGETPPPPSRRPVAREPRHQAAPPVPRPTADPRLQSVFADREGVHLTWQTSAPNAPHADASFTCRLDSEVADKLQDCFGQLGKLGYKVTGLELLRAEPEKAVQPDGPAGPAPEASPEAPPTRKAARKEEKGLTLEISTGPAPEGGKDRPVLAAPERLLVALRSGTDAAVPAEERLTCLRGTLGRGGLRITEVGFGGGKEQAPLRWEEAGVWLARQAEAQPLPKREVVAEI